MRPVGKTKVTISTIYWYGKEWCSLVVAARKQNLGEIILKKGSGLELVQCTHALVHGALRQFFIGGPQGDDGLV